MPHLSHNNKNTPSHQPNPNNTTKTSPQTKHSLFTATTTSMTVDEWWISAAISNDNIVANLLLRLKSSSSTSNPLIPPPSWPLKQPRSSSYFDINKRDPHPLPRGSPTTPLSVGPTSPSDDNIGLHDYSSRVNSKISDSTETPATTSKRHRRKKTFAQLKEEEGLLMKERTYLEKELATLRVTIQERRSTNDKLKRIKLDIQIESKVKPEPRNQNQLDISKVTFASSSSQIESDSGLLEPNSRLQEPAFVLPDLNMMPEEECGQEVNIDVC